MADCYYVGVHISTEEYWFFGKFITMNSGLNLCQTSLLFVILGHVEGKEERAGQSSSVLPVN